MVVCLEMLFDVHWFEWLMDLVILDEKCWFGVHQVSMGVLEVSTAVPTSCTANPVALAAILGVQTSLHGACWYQHGPC